MTDPVARQSVLPAGYPAVTTCVVDVDGRIDDVDIASIYALKNSNTAPSDFLPFLAWEARVDAWNPAWTDAIKRAVIQTSPEVHRHKGTVYAIKTALAALGVTAKITEWWQTSPKGAPYTFDITAFVKEPLTTGTQGALLTADVINDVHNSVIGAKPESRAFALFVAAELPATLGIAAAALARSKVRLAFDPSNSAELACGLGLATVVLTRSRIAVSCSPSDSTFLASGLGLAATFLPRQRVRVFFDFASPSQ